LDVSGADAEAVVTHDGIRLLRTGRDDRFTEARQDHRGGYDRDGFHTFGAFPVSLEIEQPASPAARVWLKTCRCS
jgi:hypothetical protein